MNINSSTIFPRDPLEATYCSSSYSGSKWQMGRLEQVSSVVMKVTEEDYTWNIEISIFKTTVYLVQNGVFKLKTALIMKSLFDRQLILSPQEAVKDSKGMCEKIVK